MSIDALTYDDGPLVWVRFRHAVSCGHFWTDMMSQVDCEMTGLNLTSDRIIEIAVIITDGQLNAVDQGIEYVIRTPKSVLDA